MENNNAYTQILTRRTIRSYEDRPVEKELVEQIVTAGQYAPSGMGKQPTAFLAVERKELRDTLARLNADVMREKNPKFNADPFYGAPLIIAVFYDPTVTESGEMDASAALENMLLAAHALGLGSCWINRAKQVFESEEGQAIKKEASIPDRYVGLSFMIAGYSTQEPKAAPRKSLAVFDL